MHTVVFPGQDSTDDHGEDVDADGTVGKKKKAKFGGIFSKKTPEKEAIKEDSPPSSPAPHSEPPVTPIGFFQYFLKFLSYHFFSILSLRANILSCRGNSDSKVLEVLEVLVCAGLETCFRQFAAHPWNLRC